MKFYASIALRHDLVRFEPDPDESPDSGSGHGFKIARKIALKVMDRFQ